MANPAKYVWLDDELKDAARSGVPVVNAGLHYGFTVFEGIRCYATDNGPPYSAWKSTLTACWTPPASLVSAICPGPALR